MDIETIRPNLVLSGCPRRPEDIELLQRDLRVTAILTLLVEDELRNCDVCWEELDRCCDRCGIDARRVPICAFDSDDLLRLLPWCVLHLRCLLMAGHVVCVHCTGEKYCSSTLILAYFVWVEHVPVEQAKEELYRHKYYWPAEGIVEQSTESWSGLVRQGESLGESGIAQRTIEKLSQDRSIVAWLTHLIPDLPPQFAAEADRIVREIRESGYNFVWTGDVEVADSTVPSLKSVAIDLRRRNENLDSVAQMLGTLQHELRHTRPIPWVYKPGLTKEAFVEENVWILADDEINARMDDIRVLLRLGKEHLIRKSDPEWAVIQGRDEISEADRLWKLRQYVASLTPRDGMITHFIKWQLRAEAAYESIVAEIHAGETKGGAKE